ncbi:MAG: alpha/beta fold hydrolase [Pseudomonadota bacterium]|nr:alpha/beta fold hydrolase [Rubrivivax sp.]MCZ8033108.1 alpha/beta hydrolase [Rubrivivax sp.]
MHTIAHLRRVLASLAVAATAIGLTACGGGGSSDSPAPPTPVPTPAPTQVPRLDESRCPYTLHPSQQLSTGVRCGELVVLQDRSNPSGPTVRIPFAVFKPATASSRAPVFYLTGGPGQTWTEVLAQVPAGFSPGFNGGAKLPRDEVVLEQRGSIATTPALACANTGSSWGPESFRDPTAELSVVLPALRACADGLIANGVQPRNFTTDDMADDVEDLRRLLGYDKVVLNGVSFGTNWGLAMLRRHGTRVDSMVLDSVVSPAVFPLRGDAQAYDSAFSALAAACAAHPACAARYPGLDDRVSTLFDRLNAMPLPWQGGPGNEANANVALSVLGQTAAFSPSSFPRLVAEMERWVNAGQVPSTLPQFIEDILIDDSSLRQTFGQLLSVTCADNATTTEAELAASVLQVRPSLRPARTSVNQSIYALCGAWPYRKDLPASAFLPVTSAVKTLILSGTFDPLTPPSWAQQVASTLPNTTVVSFPTRGHSVQNGSACSNAIVRAFLAGQAVDPSCAAAEALAFE